MTPETISDQELAAVAKELLEIDPAGNHFANIIRYTFDQLLDGRRTGRWDYRQLFKTEKTHMGTLIEINLQKFFRFADGDATDYRIAGIEVDCKFSQRIGGWEMGPEMVDHLCLVVWASDEKSSWRAGLIRATDENLRAGGNRDMKRTLTAEAVTRVLWLWPDNNTLAPNQLLHLPDEVRDRIMTATSKSRKASGIQARVNQLFREVQRVLVRRTTVETVAYGADDPLKRARGNGGARDLLRPEGITVLGHQDNDPHVAAALGLPVPHKGEFVAARLSPVEGPTTERPAARISDNYFAVALDDDLILPAPLIARKSPVRPRI
jgi:hypothetical protein